MCSGGRFDIAATSARVQELEASSEAADFWDDAKQASSVMRELNSKRRALGGYHKILHEHKDIQDFLQLADQENDNESLEEGKKHLAELAMHVATLKTECLFAGEADHNSAFLEIHAGAGGTESHDWAEMLARMYLRWAERRAFKTEILDRLDGEEAGIKSITIRIEGQYAYGWSKTESGVHRLVRMSPFNSAGKRQTSFASVWVYPVIDDSIDIVINEKDLRIDTYRASGAGGQHVNKTESAVRFTHLPTNIVVQSQSDRSQHRNRAECMAMLKARLYELELRKREDKVDAANATKTEIGWGHQIRSYVLQPYQMVKDLRSDYETSNAAGVLDGDLDPFMAARLEQIATREEK